MDCGALIDFNSPLKENSNMLDPLVPLPKYQSNYIQSSAEVVTTVGDNPFDNVILQLCKHDDPFEIIEKQAQEPNKENSPLPERQNIIKEQTTNNNNEIVKEKNNQEKNAKLINNSHNTQIKSNTTLNNSEISYSALDVDQAVSLHGKSVSESFLSSTIERIENKFSKMYLTSQFDKQILDESSKCIDSGMQDVSLEGNSVRNMSQISENSFHALDIPTRKEDVKAFVAGRIEKCIEKALNSSRSNMNCSLQHRRSLSAASLYTSTITPALYSENHFPYTSTKQSSDMWSNSFKYRNRSFSNHDLHSSFNTRMWGSHHNIPRASSGESLSTIDRWNTAFRKSSATSSMYSSCGILDTGFQKSTLSSYRPSVSSIPNHSLSQISGDDSVFLNNDTVIMGGKMSSCVFMEAKNLSSILKRRALSGDDEPIEADVNFLTDGNFQVDLVDCDSSSAEDSGEEGSGSQKIKRRQSSCGVDNKSRTRKETDQTAKNSPLPLSRDKVAGIGLRSQNIQSKKSRSPLLVPPPPVPLSSTSESRNVVLKPKSHSDSRIVNRGPMKAMIPVGNMMRHDTKKESNVLPKRSVGHQQKGAVNLPPNNKGIRRSVSTGELVLRKKKNPLVGPPKEKSPAAALCGRPVACSTPAPDDILPLVSPPVGLQLSRITSGTPAGTPIDSGHRRSKSAGSTASKKGERETHLTTTPTRKAPRRIRTEIGLPVNKQTSPGIESPEQAPAYTSTPLKPITKNSPSINRVRKPSPVNRKLLQRESICQTEKENLQPHIGERHKPLLRTSGRRMEV